MNTLLKSMFPYKKYNATRVRHVLKERGIKPSMPCKNILV